MSPNRSSSIPRSLSLFAGLETLEKDLELALSDDEAVVKRGLAEIESKTGEEPSLLNQLPLLGRAFNSGHISCQRLLETLVVPLIKLAKKLDQPTQFSDPQLSEKQLELTWGYMERWMIALVVVLRGDVVETPAGGLGVVPLLAPEKHAKLVDGIAKEGHPDVCAPPPPSRPSTLPLPLPVSSTTTPRLPHI